MHTDSLGRTGQGVLPFPGESNWNTWNSVLRWVTNQHVYACLCMKINRQTNTDTIVTGICYRLFDQDQKVDEVFFKQKEEASHSQALVFIANLNYLNNLQQGTSNLGGFWNVLVTASWHRLSRSQKGMVFC